jgi:hypothetical protein
MKARILARRNNVGIPTKRAVLYLRVSTLDQTTANQERELRDVASRMGCDIVHVYKDHGMGFEQAWAHRGRAQNRGSVWRRSRYGSAL